MSTLAEQAAKLLDFSQKLDINLLDNVVGCLYNGEGPQQQMAQQILTSLKDHPDAWTRVDTILEYASNQQTKVMTIYDLKFESLPLQNGPTDTCLKQYSCLGRIMVDNQYGKFLSKEVKSLTGKKTIKEVFN